MMEERLSLTELRVLKEHISVQERRRRTLAYNQLWNSTQRISLLWRNTLRRLTNERGPWGNKISAEAMHWKLDKTETFSRMRVKLRRNYKFDSYVGKAANSSHSNQSAMLKIDEPSTAAEPALP